MFRALLELIVTVLIALAARAIFSSLIKGFGTAASNAFQQQQQQSPRSGPAEQQPKQSSQAGELHKDPVCGTYVSESTSFRRQLSGKTVYYCSDACRQKHGA
jgi:YHS domain-containing protein